ncbi:hypothetical protein ABH19_02445 [Leptospirillum sp. Group II 'CF-1']|nr:hypothetical protein ABH19_02445 [Leptospirillum sp. Group II 'CF-1']
MIRGVVVTVIVPADWAIEKLPWPPRIELRLCEISLQTVEIENDDTFWPLPPIPPPRPPIIPLPKPPPRAPPIPPPASPPP